MMPVVTVWLRIYLGLTLALAGPLEAMQAEELHVRARERLGLGDFEAAREDFGRLLKKNPEQLREKGIPLDELHYAEAVCWWMLLPTSMDNLARARAGFQALCAAYPDSELVPYALRNLARMAELKNHRLDTVDLPLAREHYEKALAWPHLDDRLRHELVLRHAGTYIQEFRNRDQVAKGLAILERHLEAHPANPLAAGMWEYIGETRLLILEDDRRALAAYRRAEAIGFQDMSLLPETYWRMARLAERSEADPAVAASYYLKIIRETPRSGRVFESTQRLLALRETHPGLDVELPALGGVPR